MIRVNLLRDPHSQPAARAAAAKDEPEEAIKEVKTMSNPTGKSSPIGGILAFLLCAGLSGLYFYRLNGNIASEEERHKSLEAEKKELEPYLKLEEQFRLQKEVLKKKEDALTKLKKQQQTPVYFFTELYNSLPDNIGFVSLTSKGAKIEIKGVAPTDDAIYQFRDSLASRSQWFSQVNYTGANRKNNRLEFGMTFDLLNP